jgi:hypothetical protein
MLAWILSKSVSIAVGSINVAASSSIDGISVRSERWLHGRFSHASRAKGEWLGLASGRVSIELNRPHLGARQHANLIRGRSSRSGWCVLYPKVRGACAQKPSTNGFLHERERF